MRVTYTLRNGSRIPKPWLEVHNPTTLPGGLPGRADHARRPWRSDRGSSGRRSPGAATSASSRCTSGPATRSGSSRPRPRSGRASASSSTRGSSRCRCGSCPRRASRAATPRRSGRSRRRRSPRRVRPYAPGDSMNRIHWKSTARHGEIQVKEFDLEQTADAWIILDLQRGIQAGHGEESTTEAAIRAAASIADKALAREPRRRHDRECRPDRVPAGRPRRTPAPEGHAAARGGRGRFARRRWSRR